MTYCWKCKECKERVENQTRDPAPLCFAHGSMVRDYKAEGVAVDKFALKVGGTRAARREPEGEGGVTFA